MTDIIKELEDRGYIEQLTHEKEMKERERQGIRNTILNVQWEKDSLFLLN